MLDKLEQSEVILIIAVSFFAITGGAGLAFDDGVESGAEVRVGGAGWFESVREHCNPVEVGTSLAWQPPPPGRDGTMYEAACYALAGHTGQAREVIESLSPELRPQAAGVVFEVGHPAADAGDDIAAGPLMELVVEYWPNHYMALYHAGAARFDAGDYAEAEGYLQRFLKAYPVDDGWTRDARSMLERID